jgi:Probable sensor domain DACNV
VIQPTYAAARLAADRIHRYLATHSIPAQFSAERVASLPDATTLAALIDAAFWASLRREESYIPRVSLAFVAPGQVNDAVAFAISLSLEPKELSKLAAAVERVGLHLGVWPQQDELRVWGITRNLPAFCLILEVVLPGLLVVKRSPSEDSGKFINIAVLQGDEIKIIDPQAAMSPAYPNLLTSLLRLESQFATGSEVNVLLQLAVSMRTHGRGGVLLVVPVASDAWNESILQPITYSVAPAFSGLADLMRTDVEGKPSRRWEDALGRVIDEIAGLTAVDGATLISADYKLLAFGAKIVRRVGSPQVAQVIVTEPIEGGSPVIAEPAQFGGTRHLSAAQFVHDQRDAIALVASQDGRFTVFAWSPSEEMVHAHRIDALLL